MPAADGVQAMTAHANQQAERRESPAMAACDDSLIEDADHDERSDNSKDGHLSIVTLAGFVRNLKQYARIGRGIGWSRLRGSTTRALEPC
jgi:hypothetical protein